MPQLKPNLLASQLHLPWCCRRWKHFQTSPTILSFEYHKALTGNAAGRMHSQWLSICGVAAALTGGFAPDCWCTDQAFWMWRRRLLVQSDQRVHSLSDGLALYWLLQDRSLISGRTQFPADIRPSYTGYIVDLCCIGQNSDPLSARHRTRRLTTAHVQSTKSLLKCLFEAPQRSPSLF